MGIFTNLGALLLGKDTSWSKNSNRSKAFQEVLDAGTNDETYLGDLLRKYTGSALTTAEQQANAWTASREDLAWSRQMDAANTAYQRQVADMQAAGINPMMAANSSGAAVPSAGGSQSVSPSGASLNLGSIISALTGASVAQKQKEVLDSEIARNEADVNLKNSQADKNAAETKGTNIDNEIKALTKDAQIESASLKNQLDRSNVRLIENKSDEVSASVRKMAAETSESIERVAYLEASSILQRATAYQIVELLPYEKAYKQAATDNQKTAALLAAAHTAYQNKLIDDGYIDAFIRNAKAEAGSAESKEELDNIKAAIRTGDYSKVHHQYGLTRDVLSTLAIILDNFNPLGGLLK